MEKRRAKRIADRKVKNEVSEEEKPLLTLIANIIAEIAITEMNRDDEIGSSHNSLNKTCSSTIKTKRKKNRV
jgi:hypothetical protein